MEERRNRHRRVYGNEEEFDNLFGWFRSRDKKEKDKLDIEQKNANVRLTNTQNLIADAKAKAEVFRAQAEQMKAIAAEKLAQKANTQLEGAKATNNLKYLAMGIVAIVLVSGIGFTIYMIKQGKKSALISAQLKKAKLQTA